MTTPRQKLIDILKDPSMGYKEYSAELKAQQDELQSIGAPIQTAIGQALKDKKVTEGGAPVDIGGGYKMQIVQKMGTGGSGYNHYQLVNSNGDVIYDTTDRTGFTNNATRVGIAQEKGLFVKPANAKGDYGFDALAKEAGLSTTNLYDWKDQQFEANKATKGDYGTFINNAGKSVVADSFKKAQGMKALGFPMTKEGTSFTPEEKTQFASGQSGIPRKDLQAIAEGKAGTVSEANRLLNTGSTAEDSTVNAATLGGGNDVVTLPTGQLVSKAKAIEMGYGEDSTGVNGYKPSYKGVFKGKENVLANDVQTNELFKQYHGRDANVQELNYWRGKKLGDIETMFTQTTIFSKEDADKIRAQMMAKGLTSISNQAELEKLVSEGKLSPDAITKTTESGSMLFQGASGSGNQVGAGGTGDTTGGTGTGGDGSGTVTGATTPAPGSGNGEDAIIDAVVNAVGDVNASETDILDALNTIKNGQIDPYYKQLVSQAQADVTKQISRSYEDRIRQLQTESFNMAENIKNTQKSLEASGQTFTGEAISKLGTLAAFGQSTPAGMAPAQLDQNGNPVSGGNVVPGQTLPQTAVGLPTMTPEQMGIEGSVNMQNRLYSESSRSQFNRGLEDIGQNALRYLGTQGVAGLNLPSQALAGQPNTTGTMQYDYANTLQNAYGNLANQEGTLTDYQQNFL